MNRVRSTVAVSLILAACASNPADDPTSRHADEMVRLWARGRAQAENGDFAAAIATFRTMSVLAPGHVEPLAAWALAARRGEDFELAERLLARAGAIDPGHPKVLFQKALLHNHRFEHRAAVRALRAIDPAPNAASYFYQLGIALQATSDLGPARDALERAVTLDPQLFQARYALYLALREHDPAAAATHLEELERQRTEQPQWIRGNLLRLEEGPLTAIEWPHESRETPALGVTLTVELEPVRNVTADGTRVTAYGPHRFLRTATATNGRAELQVTHHIDVLRIEWPNGIVQNLLDLELTTHLTLAVKEELFIKGSWGGVRVE